MSNALHYTATVDIQKITRIDTRNNREVVNTRDKEEVMRVTVRDETLRGLVNKVTAILEVNVPTPAMVEAREGE
ncbi:hypothetical protein SEA_CHRISTIAN_36 [Arthrobacter phage Christian]|uniref:Uncharacterized protein n=2 Tax=Korravirus drrobert TaxID=1982078 RepID=A0A222ZGC5_9CAUD|nr:hypothetical protein SEA_CHRISTIAN_36 [Arthrobacter phage Christian]AZS08695.1 hypothetical protein SEA_LENNOX_36 [Arthrobacter phage Lennox]